MAPWPRDVEPEEAGREEEVRGEAGHREGEGRLGEAGRPGELKVKQGVWEEPWEE